MSDVRTSAASTGGKTGAGNVGFLLRAVLHCRTRHKRKALIKTEGPISVAQRVVVTFSDYIEGGEASETVTFGLDGRSYEIDLNSANATKLRSALAPYVEAGRKRSRSGRAYRRTDVAPDPRAVRAWAESNGFDVPPRGRIPKKVYEAFNAAR
jgi:hypothetical protein